MISEVVFGLILLIASYLDCVRLKVYDIVSGLLWVASALLFPMSAVPSILLFGLFIVFNFFLGYIGKKTFGWADVLIAPVVLANVLLGNLSYGFAGFVIAYVLVVLFWRGEKKPMVPLLLFAYLGSLLH